MIDQLTIDKIRDTAQILDVVSDYVSLRRRGQNYVGLCPFHADKNPSFYVSPAKNICKCFSCPKIYIFIYIFSIYQYLNIFP